LKGLLSSFKEPSSHPQPKQEREREGRKRGRGWRGWGDDAACEKKQGQFEFFGQKF
jgi:hypothetical protein